MKDIIIALFSAMGGALVTFTVTTNYYSKRFYKRNVFQRIGAFINLGNNVYNDEKEINKIVDEKTKNKPDEIISDEEPENLKNGNLWIRPY